MATRKMSEAQHLAKIRRDSGSLKSAKVRRDASIVAAHVDGVQRTKIAEAAGIARAYVYKIVEQQPGGKTK